MLHFLLEFINFFCFGYSDFLCGFLSCLMGLLLIWIFRAFLKLCCSCIHVGFWKVLAKTQKSMNIKTTLVNFGNFWIQNFVKITKVLKTIMDFWVFAKTFKISCEYNCSKVSKIHVNTTHSKLQKSAGNSKILFSKSPALRQPQQKLCKGDQKKLKNQHNQLAKLCCLFKTFFFGNFISYIHCRDRISRRLFFVIDIILKFTFDFKFENIVGFNRVGCFRGLGIEEWVGVWARDAVPSLRQTREILTVWLFEVMFQTSVDSKENHRQTTTHQIQTYIPKKIPHRIITTLPFSIWLNKHKKIR